MIKLENRRKNGRNDYPIRVMWNLIIAMKVFQYKDTESFRKELSRNKQLREICGLTDDMPRKHLVHTSGAFSRFIKLLKSEQEEIDKLFASLVEKLYECKFRCRSASCTVKIGQPAGNSRPLFSPGCRT